MFKGRGLMKITIVVLLLAGLSFGYLYFLFRQDLSAAKTSLAHARSRVIDTACGPIEYVEGGSGAPVLVVHGAAGGFDQGLSMAADFVGDGFHYIAPSRFGYLNTPLPADASPAAQADAHACLLDALGIERISVMGMSAGALSTLQFALRYPERTAGIILLSPDGYAPERQTVAIPQSAEWAFKSVLKSDFAIWLAMKAQLPMIMMYYWIPPEMEAAITPEQEEELNAFKAMLMPVSQRAAGMFNDAKVSGMLERYPLEEIKTPALIIASPDDPTHAFLYGEYTAKNMPNAALINLGSGGHMLFGHQDQIKEEVCDFLQIEIQP